MNSNYGKRSSGSSINAFDFDLGLGSNQGKPLNGQKSQTPSYSQQPRPAFQPGKPSWTHQPAPKQKTIRSEIGGPTSMVGDIHGKTWSSSSSSGSGSGIGIVNKDPSLFGDLVGSVIGKSSGNVPLKKAPPKSSYSMGNLADSLPKTGNSMNSASGGWGYSGNPGGYSSSGGSGSGVNASNSIKTPNLGGPSMKSMSGSNLSSSGLPSNGDPFGNLVGFGSKSSGSINSEKAKNDANSDAAFGTFQSGVANPSGGFAGTTTPNDDFGGFQDAAKSSTFSSGGFDASNVGFGVQSSVKDDPLGMFSTSTNTSAAAAPQSEDWGFESFDGGADSGGGSTTELDGLPPPPPGVSAASAKSKGIDNQRQGQYADAIKWLSWAVILLERAGDDAGSAEVLSTRASCYKEVGEYKKAVSDCTKVLDHDEKNVTILVQRALLYESMEKYKLGAEDLRMVLKKNTLKRERKDLEMEGKEEDVRVGANKFPERQPIGTSAQSDKDYKEPPPAPLFEPGELASWSFWRAGIAEFIATFLFLYITVLTVMGVKRAPNMCASVGIQGIAWAFGGMIFALVYCTAGISGGHINPAVTFGLFLARKLSLTRAVYYIVMQCLGAICGAGVVKGFQPKQYQALGGGANTVAPGYTKGSGLGAEIIGTFVLVYTVFSATDAKRNARDSHVPILAPLPIGFAVFLVHLATIPITGTGINPARSLGAAIIFNKDNAWDDHWVFWVGPFIGAALAALYHVIVIRAIPFKSRS